MTDICTSQIGSFTECDKKRDEFKKNKNLWIKDFKLQMMQ